MFLLQAMSLCIKNVPEASIRELGSLVGARGLSFPRVVRRQRPFLPAPRSLWTAQLHTARLLRCYTSEELSEVAHVTMMFEVLPT